MKYLTVLLYFSVLLSLSQVAFCGDEDRLFYDAVRAEASGNLDQAIDYYLKASKISHSANLYGNLANLFFKKEQFGLAILYFRKALLLQPRNSELATNLAFAYEMAKIPKSKEGFKGSYFSENTISLWGLFCTLIFWTGLLILIYLFFFNTKLHKSSDGINWFLVRSKNGNQKGWIREDEFGWIIDPAPRT